MAAGLAIGLANGVLEKLGQIATQAALDEASLLLNFKYDFQWLQKKLRQIFPSLQAADEQSEHSEDVKDWLADLRNIAFDAEDIIDECSVQHLYTNSRGSCLHNCSQSVFRWKMGRRIRELKDRIRSAIKEAKELKLLHDVTHLSQPSTSSTSQSERGAGLRSLSFLDRDAPAPVAIDFKVDEILTLLENPSIGVVAVVGMGGVGKTFLLQHLYNREKHRYECSAWISVSQSCSLRKLQCDIASHIELEISNGVTDSRAAGLIHGKLDGKRCLIVLDDVWRNSVDQDVWRNSVDGNLISTLGLPTGHCKIVITTRSRDVAEKLNAQYIYEMQRLSNDESWDLFCQIAFRDREGNMAPEQVESLAHQIVKECGRLPLALKTVAASMANCSLISDWQSKLGQLKKVTNTEDSTMKILKLSYDSLPPHLKSCFAYFSFFPDDIYISFSTFKISKADIFHDYVLCLWIAEGFIPQEESRDKWDIALDYLHQLENLCLVEKNNVYSCYTIHDMLLDLAVNICKEHDCKFDLPSKKTSCRRLVVVKKDIAINEISERLLNCHHYIRTLSFSQNPRITSIPQQLFDHVRVLRVIDFSRTAISTLPSGVGNLKLLKVLNLSYTEIREVPECVRRLKCLQYLDVSYCKSLQSLPSWIGELKSLSYFNVQWSSNDDTVIGMPKGVSQLSSLSRLKSDYFTLYFDENEFLSVKYVGNLTNLQELKFCVKDVRVLRSVEDGILERLVKMKILSVTNIIPAMEEGDSEESSLPTFPEKMNVMKDLQQLQLTRFSVPSWICGMENLTDLVLEKCSDYPQLQKLPNLQMLKLDNDSKCRELPKEFGESGGFPKLVKLQIVGFSVLEELPALEEGAMQRLEGLAIKNCGRVKRVPEGLERLRRLKRIGVSGERSGELEEGGEDWKRIKAKNSRTEIFFYD